MVVTDLNDLEICGRGHCLMAFISEVKLKMNFKG